MAKGKDERHHPNRKVDKEALQAGGGWGEAVGRGLGVAAGGAIRPSEAHLDDSERLVLRLDEAMRASGARPL